MAAILTRWPTTKTGFASGLHFPLSKPPMMMRKASLLVEAQHAPAFIHQLPRGGHPKRGASGAGSRQQSANDLQASPRTGATGRGTGVVWPHASGQESNTPAGRTTRKSEGKNFGWTGIVQGV